MTFSLIIDEMRLSIITFSLMEDCCYAESFILSVTYKPSMLIVVMLSVVAPINTLNHYNIE